MLLTIDTAGDFSEADRLILQLLLDRSGGAEVAKTDAKVARTRKTATAPPAPPEDTDEDGSDPNASPEPKEDVGPSLDDAITRATELVSAGKSAVVKKALAAVGAKRVSEVKPGSVADFLAALDAA